MLGLIFCFFTFAAACSTNLRNATISSNITSSLENRVELLEQIIFASLEKQEKSVKVAIDEHEKRVRNLKVELNEIRTDPVEDAKNLLPIGGVELEEILGGLFKTSTPWKCGISIYVDSLNIMDE